MRGHVFPILQLILLPLCCTATYLWSVLLGHVEAGWPYISDTGTYPPESCLFGLLLALYSFLTAITVYLRWRQVRTHYVTDGSRGLHIANNVGLVLGLLASFGVLLVANFQESNVLPVHLTGATLAFAVGAIYTWFQTAISYKAHLLPGHHACVRHFRLAVSVLVTVCCVLVVVFAGMAKAKNDGQDPTDGLWTSEVAGWKEHVMSTVLEWVLAFLSAAFFASFCKEFKHFTVAMPVEFTVAEVKVTNCNGTTEQQNSNELQHASFKMSTVS